MPPPAAPAAAATPPPAAASPSPSAVAAAVWPVKREERGRQVLLLRAGGIGLPMLGSAAMQRTLVFTEV